MLAIERRRQDLQAHARIYQQRSNNVATRRAELRQARDGFRQRAVIAEGIRSLLQRTGKGYIDAGHIGRGTSILDAAVTSEDSRFNYEQSGQELADQISIADADISRLTRQSREFAMRATIARQHQLLLGAKLPRAHTAPAA